MSCVDRFSNRVEQVQHSDPNADIHATRAKKADAWGSFLDEDNDGRVNVLDFATVYASKSPPSNAEFDKFNKSESREPIGSCGSVKFLERCKEEFCYGPE